MLHRFQRSDGSIPYGGLVFDQQGTLYGTTAFGGQGNHGFGYGVVFSITP